MAEIFSLMQPDQSMPSQPKYYLGSCSTLASKQDVDIISFPVINPTVALE